MISQKRLCCDTCDFIAFSWMVVWCYEQALKLPMACPPTANGEEINNKNDALVSIVSAGALFRPDLYNSSIESWDLLVKATQVSCALPMLFREGKDWHMTPSNTVQGSLYLPVHLRPERRAPLCQAHGFVILPSCPWEGRNNTLVWFVSSNLYGSWSHSLLHYSNLPWQYCWNFTRWILMKSLTPSSASQGTRSR